jgi:hypothetical protein
MMATMKATAAARMMMNVFMRARTRHYAGRRGESKAQESCRAEMSRDERAGGLRRR